MAENKPQFASVASFWLLPFWEVHNHLMSARSSVPFVLAYLQTTSTGVHTRVDLVCIYPCAYVCICMCFWVRARKWIIALVWKGSLWSDWSKVYCQARLASAMAILVGQEFRPPTVRYNGPIRFRIKSKWPRKCLPGELSIVQLSQMLCACVCTHGWESLCASTLINPLGIERTFREVNGMNTVRTKPTPLKPAITFIIDTWEGEAVSLIAHWF